MKTRWNLQKALKVFIFTTDNASDIVLENYIYVVSDILPYAL
jgi:hypothetical protein